MSRFVKRRYLRNTSLSRTQRILQAKLVGRVATHKTCAQAAILDNLYYFDFGCLTKRHMKFYTPSGDILSSTIKPLNTMNYNIINFENIPDKWTFYYLSEDGQQLKCKKIGKWGFKYKQKNITIKRMCPLNENWYCVIAERSFKEIME